MHEIRMAHPAKNALGNDLMGWLEEELARAGDQPVLLVGTDDAFCAGLNLVELAELKGDDLAAFCMRVDKLGEALYTHPAPTVACVNGHAIAGGCVLAMCCDHRVATSNPRTKIGLNEVALGVSFPLRILKMLVQRLPNQHRARVLLGAGLFGPEEALRLGLVDELSDDPETLARERLAELARNPAPAYARTKSALRRAIALTEGEEREFLEVDFPIWSSQEVADRVLAVLGK